MDLFNAKGGQNREASSSHWVARVLGVGWGGVALWSHRYLIFVKSHDCSSLKLESGSCPLSNF